VLNKQDELYDLNEQQVYAKTLQLYSNAAWLDPPTSLSLECKQTYYPQTAPGRRRPQSLTNVVARA
jgi:hypothetical protein